MSTISESGGYEGGAGAEIEVGSSTLLVGSGRTGDPEEEVRAAEKSRQEETVRTAETAVRTAMSQIANLLAKINEAPPEKIKEKIGEFIEKLRNGKVKITITNHFP